VRTGPPIDDAEDLAFPTWAGVLPLEMKVGEAIGDEHLLAGKGVPEYVRGYTRKG